MSNKSLILLFITSFTYSSYSQGFIKPMLCEGKLPLDLKNSIEDIVNNKKLNAFNKKNLLSVYEIISRFGLKSFENAKTFYDKGDDLEGKN